MNSKAFGESSILDKGLPMAPPSLLHLIWLNAKMDLPNHIMEASIHTIQLTKRTLLFMALCKHSILVSRLLIISSI
jgi:hypothetical protein